MYTIDAICVTGSLDLVSAPNPFRKRRDHVHLCSRKGFGDGTSLDLRASRLSFSK